MYKIEIDRFNNKIDEQRISMSAKIALHDIVDEFFSIDYQNISDHRRREIEEDFKMRCLEYKMTRFRGSDRSDNGRAEDIFSQIETCLFTILDQSVDKLNPEKVETEYNIEVSSDKIGASFRKKKSK